MGFQKVEYSLPHEQEENDLEIESSSAIEIDLSGKAKPRKVEEETDSEVDIEVVDVLPLQKKLQTKNLESTQKKSVSVYSTLVKATTMNVGQKNKLTGNAKN